MKPLWTLWIVLFPLGTRPAAAQTGTALREQILQAEDRRARSATDFSLLTRAMSSPDRAVALAAIRALGRLERPDVAGILTPRLGDASPVIRAATVEALAQAAQGFRGESSLSHRGHAWPGVVTALASLLTGERDSLVRAALARALGRLPYVTSEEIGLARERLRTFGAPVGENPGVSRNIARALETLTRATGRRVPLDSAMIQRLRALAAPGLDQPTRRHALGALIAGQAADRATIVAMLGSTDPQSRRLAVTVLGQVPNDSFSDGLFGTRARLAAAARIDAAPMVRIETLRTQARLGGPDACAWLFTAASDTVTAVALQAIDLLGNCAGNPPVTEWLDRASAVLLVPRSPLFSAPWHRAAHALVSLARVSPERARARLAMIRPGPDWQLRMYAARAGAAVPDTQALLRYAADSVPNVRETAIAGLSTVLGHGADSVYRAALASSDYQLLLGAATALAGSPARRVAVGALLRALDRTTRDRRETSRDARVALLTRVHQLGDARDSGAVISYLQDFDPLLADSAAATLVDWTGRPHRAAPKPLRWIPVSWREVEGLRGKRFRLVLDRGVVDVELNLDETPVTVVRLARLIRRKYYDGLTLHRVVPNFVLQGGSPGANEYAGDGPFMRDELGPRSHERGTLGISTRGRDTGDGQLFINLVDNPRLDYEYTVWGWVVSGMEVLDGVLEGEVIRRIEIRPR
ncbi:MAG TPA: peptidylprolyl isomerase [Gemmatimonadales bacterium]|nr:peptidylprolyl isomerase [Gemmatimonadales bacterium]